MTTESEVAIPICNANEDGAEEVNVQPSRTRESLPPVTDEPNYVAVRNRRGKRPPVAHESDDPEEHRGSTPFTEDPPSPRCVLRDYAEGAAHFGHDAPALAAAYWVFAVIPLAVHMLAAFPLHQATQRPGRFWVCVLIAGILAAIVIH